jgi:hypothetical protein
MFEQRKTTGEDTFSSLSLPTTRPIDVHLSEDYITLTAQGTPIVRANREDLTSLYSAVALLNGVIGAGLTMDEIVRVRDLLQEVTGS